MNNLGAINSNTTVHPMPIAGVDPNVMTGAATTTTQPPANDVVGGGTPASDNTTMQKPVENVVTEAATVAIAAAGAAAATTATDEKKPDANAVHSVSDTAVAPTAAAPAVPAAPALPPFSFNKLAAAMKEDAKAEGKDTVSPATVISTLLKVPEIEAQFATHGIDVAKLIETLKMEIAAEPKPATIDATKEVELPAALKDAVFKIALKENYTGSSCPKEVIKEVLQGLEKNHALPKTFEALNLDAHMLAGHVPHPKTHEEHAKTSHHAGGHTL